MNRQRPAGKSTVPNKQPPQPRFELWVDGHDSFKVLALPTQCNDQPHFVLQRFFDELKTQKKKCDRALYENLEEVRCVLQRTTALHDHRSANHCTACAPKPLNCMHIEPLQRCVVSVNTGAFCLLLELG